jgi:hypothetical protein
MNNEQKEQMIKTNANREAFGGLLAAESFFELFIIPAYHFYKEIGR